MTTKAYMLRMKKEINTFGKNDKRYNEFVKEHNEYKEALRETYAKIKNLGEEYPNEEERNSIFATLDENMSHLSELIKLNEQETDEYLDNKFNEFKNRYPIIFKRFLQNDLDTAALTHALDTLNLLEQGNITREQGNQMGYEKFHNQITD